jgi:hypothetical protein
MHYSSADSIIERFLPFRSMVSTAVYHVLWPLGSSMALARYTANAPKPSNTPMSKARYMMHDGISSYNYVYSHTRWRTSVWRDAP